MSTRTVNADSSYNNLVRFVKRQEGTYGIDDVRKRLSSVPSYRAGALMSKAYAEGLIKPVGSHRSKNPSSRRRVVTTWRTV